MFGWAERRVTGWRGVSRVLVVAAYGSVLFGRVAAADGSKYCIDNGSTMLLTHVATNGSLEFGLSLWTSRGHNFSVSGVAQPEAGGWHFQENMRSADPAERCDIRIAPLAGGDGYTFTVTDKGSCEAEGGYGASPLPNRPTIFPARSRQADLPRGKTVAQGVSMERSGESCDKPRRR